MPVRADLDLCIDVAWDCLCLSMSLSYALLGGVINFSLTL